MRSHCMEAARSVVRIFQQFQARCSNSHNMSEPLRETQPGQRWLFRGGLIVVGLLSLCLPAQAEYSYKLSYDQKLYATPADACESQASLLVASACPYGGCYPVRLVSENVIEPPVPYRDSVIYYCSITIELLNYPPVYGSPLRTYTHWWMVRLGTPDICEAGLTADPYTGKCPVVECLVGPLSDFPPAGDLCSASLEAGNGKDVNNACPASSVMSDPKGEPCLAQKLGVLGIPYAGPTSTIRTAAYQQHLGDVFDLYWQHQWLITDPVAYQACTARRAIVEAEMSKHGIDYAPARIDSAHLDGTAFDISRGTADTLKRVLAQAGRDVSGLLSEPLACNLKWGGLFPDPDRVHFYTPKPVPAP